VLYGGCFQNCQLTERCVQRLIDAGFRPYWHQRVPPKRCGIALVNRRRVACGGAPQAETKEVLIA